MAFDPVKSVLAAGGKHGLSDNEKRDPIGLAVVALNKFAQSDLIDRLGLRKTSEQTVFRVTSAGFKTASAAGRAFARVGGKGGGKRVPSAQATGLFDLTPSEDEQMLVDVVTDFADEVVRPAAAEANESCVAPEELLKASLEIGLPILGVAEDLGGIATERSAVAGVLVHEALAKGDMGLAVASLASGAVATALSLYGTDEQQSTFLPAFAGDEVPAAALVLAEPTALFDPLTPATTATRKGSGFVLNGLKSGVVRGAEAELFLIGAELDGKPQLFLVESTAPGITVVSDPSMGVRAAGITRLELKDVALEEIALFGDEATYREVVQNSRLAWCALSLGTAQAVLDYVTPYVKERHAFGEPIAHRQSVAFKVADIAIELQGMRLVTYKAASRVAQGKDASREIALARRLCAERGMGIGNDGVQLLGGHGFVKEHPVERWYRDLRAIGILEGGVLV
ncbi:acyl-CoA dehydrogenase [Nocardioides marmoriginsengisoli]|uniref:Acyl-CoA dehydrogenase n=1 Tax=Nocardioides marmoriginsengisoli TaxID=661483 RepID=A0A3N0CSB7_9ACTN|nr:acyl-CoA dehydrogenase family protein [Nocardioides marmoriginsengisoli]RNL65793.1 acyl-CoA dehydrogenase [Nocardioides marmoriginsengisoli]